MITLDEAKQAFKDAVKEVRTFLEDLFAIERELTALDQAVKRAEDEKKIAAVKKYIARLPNS